jgi:hypothetical protein
MPNRSTPYGGRYKGWFFDQVNGRLEFYYNSTLVYWIDATQIDVDAIANFDGAVDMDSTLSEPTANRVQVSVLGTNAAVASNGAGALLSDIGFVAPHDLQIVSAWARNISASDVTVGTATSSASYRRVTLVTNTAGTGSGTDIVASLNAQASLASNATRAFTTVASTVPAGAIILASHLTVGAETADGTDMAARRYQIAYVRV